MNTEDSRRAAGAAPAVRSFSGSSLRAVYDQIRQTLGPDALIIDQRREGGRVTVTASRELPPELAAPRRTAAPPRNPEVRAALDRRGDGLAAAGSPRERAPLGRSDDGDAVLRLTALGLDPALLALLPATLRQSADPAALLETLIPLHRAVQPLCGRFRLIGPPGAGKTTALIKLLAARVLRFGAAGALLLGTDRKRLAGGEQLAFAAELLEVPYQECSEAELPDLLSRSGHLQLVLVDSAGFDPRRGVTAAPLQGLDDLLVLPAHWQAACLRRLAAATAARLPAGVVLTQTDQCAGAAELLNLLSEWRLPLWWLGDSPDVSAELQTPSGQRLLELLEGSFDQSSTPTIVGE